MRVYVHNDFFVTREVADKVARLYNGVYYDKSLRRGLIVVSRLGSCILYDTLRNAQRDGLTRESLKRYYYRYI